MRNRFRSAGLLALLIAGLMAGPTFVPAVQAQTPGNAIWQKMLDGETVAANVTADDTIAAGLLVKYVGTAVASTVAVDGTSGDITFTDSETGSDAATTTFECPVSGALGGVIDVSDTACDTLGEVVDIINASSNWRAVIIDGVRSDATTVGMLQSLSATSASTEDGRLLYWDTSRAFLQGTTYALNAPRSMTQYLTTGGGASGYKMVVNPYAGRRTSVVYLDATSTYGSGTSTAQIISVATKLRSPTGSSTAGTETATTIWSQAGEATTVNKVFTLGTFGVLCKKDEKCLVRLNNSAAAASVRLVATGLNYRY